MHAGEHAARISTNSMCQSNLCVVNGAELLTRERNLHGHAVPWRSNMQPQTCFPVRLPGNCATLVEGERKVLGHSDPCMYAYALE